MAKSIKISFDEYYENIFNERWNELKKSLQQERKHYPFLEPLLKPYYLDEASIWAANALEVCEGDSVLDMCAAPGGKTLVLATHLNGVGEIVANEFSRNRRDRLKNVLRDHLPENLLKAITLSGKDGTLIGLNVKESFDKILLDAPCSSERHLLSAEEEYTAEWSTARTKNLAIKQHSLLCSAFHALKRGGTLIYSTCALSPLENDGVIRKFLKKRGELATILPLALSAGETTEYGIHILPDVCEGKGPLYLCKLRKNEV